MLLSIILILILLPLSDSGLLQLRLGEPAEVETASRPSLRQNGGSLYW